MSGIKDGGPAFPSGDGEFGGGPNHAYGMTLHDWFAGQALSGGMAGAKSGFSNPKDAARNAYAVADAMLAARSK